MERGTPETAKVSRTCARLLLAIAALMAVAVACSSQDSEPGLRLVTTSNIVADWARQVGGDRVQVFALLPLGADPHTFQPGARDVTRIAEADLVLSVGLGLEAGWLKDLLENAAADPSRVVALGEAIEPLPFDDPEEGPFDPHFWFDPLRVQQAVTEIAVRLSAIDPDGGSAYEANAKAYNKELDGLHAWIGERVALLPRERRRLVTSHDSYQYFADRYGFDIVGTVMLGVTTEREPSAAEMTRLVDEVRKQDVAAVFTETTMSDRLARTVADETGVQVVSELYTGSLGTPDTGADTYVGMMRTDVEIMVDALK